MRLVSSILAAILLLASARPYSASAQAVGASDHERTAVPALEALVGPGAEGGSALRDVVNRYVEDHRALRRRYDAPHAPERRSRLEAFYRTWQDRLQAVDFEPLGVEGRIDYVLLENELRYRQHELALEAERYEEMLPFVPFAPTVSGLFYRWRSDPVLEPRAVADTVAALAGAVASLHQRLDQRYDEPPARTQRIVAFRAARALADMTETLDEWYTFYEAYDPLFTWWVEEPYAAAREALAAYDAFLRRDVVGIPEGGDPPVVGDPIGAEAMTADLAYEVIPYEPAELIAIAEDEFAWCEDEMRKAAQAMGYGDDWHAALEAVKELYVSPGEQPELVRMLAEEAVAFLRERDLITIPPLAEEVWRMTMLSPERQKVSPFFLGGEVVQISYPTDGMSHADKLMSMRGNNPHFSRATVHHELIPGHHLQGFMTDRYNSHRNLFRTPFWGEGWALYWEMRLWEEGFPQTPEDKVGMLFWRMHRAARIIFSLGFHLGEVTPQEAVDFLVERVGHERANAEAEVRRSFNGSYPPLYQAAYMLGGLQFRALHEELVEDGPMTDRAFHDAILRGGRMPVEMVRARLRGELLERDHTAVWRFAGDPGGAD